MVTLVNSVVFPGSTNGGTSSTIDTTTSTITIGGIVAIDSIGALGNFTDNQIGNTYTKIIYPHTTPTDFEYSLWYKLLPTTSTTHDFTQTGSNTYNSFIAAGFNALGVAFGAATSGVQVSSGSTTIQPGSLTVPSGALYLVVVTLSDGITTMPTISSGFTLLGWTPHASNAEGSAVFWAVGTGAALNPTITYAGSTAEVGCGAAYFTTTGGGGTNVNLTGAASTAAAEAFGIQLSKTFSAVAATAGFASITPSVSHGLSDATASGAVEPFAISESKTLVGAATTATAEPFALQDSKALVAAATTATAEPFVFNESSTLGAATTTATAEPFTPSEPFPLVSAAALGGAGNFNFGSTNVNLIGASATAHAASFVPNLAIGLTAIAATGTPGTFVGSALLAFGAVATTAHAAPFTPTESPSLTGVAAVGHAAPFTESVGITLSGAGATAAVGLLTGAGGLGLPPASATGAVGVFAKAISVTLQGVSAEAVAASFVNNVGLTAAITIAGVGNLLVRIVGPVTIIQCAKGAINNPFETASGTINAFDVTIGGDAFQVVAITTGVMADFPITLIGSFYSGCC